MGRITGADPDGPDARGVSRRLFIRCVGAFAALAGCGRSASESSVVNGSATVGSPSSSSSSTTSTPDTGATAAPSATSSSTTVDGAPPTLAITFPEDGARFCGVPIDGGPSYVPQCTVDGPEVTFEGTVSAGSDVLSRGAPAQVADGRWTLALRLDEGTHEVAFVARDVDGREATASVTVSYEERESSDF